MESSRAVPQPPSYFRRTKSSAQTQRQCKHWTLECIVNPKHWTLVQCQCSNKSENLTFDPPLLKDCEVGKEVIVNWNVEIAHPNVTSISIYITDGVKETLFAQGGAVGNSKTGPWARPGTHFILRDNETKKMLEESTIDGPKC
jgi:hypothetical protein